MKATEFTVRVPERFPGTISSDQSARKDVHDIAWTFSCTRRAGKGCSANAILELAIDRLTIEDPEERTFNTKTALPLDGVGLIRGPNFIRGGAGIVRSVLRGGDVGLVVGAVLLPTFLVGVDVFLAELGMGHVDEGGQLTDAIGRCVGVAIPVDVEFP